MVDKKKKKENIKAVEIIEGKYQNGLQFSMYSNIRIVDCDRDS